MMLDFERKRTCQARLNIFYFLIFEANAGLKVFAIYYTGANLLHFLYDGWMWRIRNRKVLVPLVTS